MNKGVLVGAGLATVLFAGLGGIYAYQRHTKAVACEALTETTTRLSDCLIGEAAGALDAALDHELLASRAAFAPDESDASWPRRCRPYADPIGQALRRAHRAGVISFEAPLESVITLLRAGKLVHDDTGAPDVKELLLALEDFRHGAHDPSVPKPPPPALPLLAHASVHPISGKPDYLFVGALQLANHGARLGLSGDSAKTASTATCEYDAAARKLRCKRASRAYGGFVEGDIGAPIVFLEENGTGSGIVDEKAVKLIAVDPGVITHARSLSDGGIAVTAVDGDESSALVRASSGQVVKTRFDQRVRLPGGERVAGTFVVWKQLPELDSSLAGPGSPGPPAALLARSFADAAARTITVGTVGRRPPSAARTDGSCEADALFVDMSPAVVARDAKGSWHVLDQEPLSDFPQSVRSMSCDGERLDIIDASESEVKRQRCTPTGGCKTERVSVKLPLTLPFGNTVIAAGDEVVAVWHDAKANAMYFVRSSLKDLPTATPKPLVDSQLATDSDAVDDTATRMAAFGAEVLVLLRRTDATYAIVIHEDGTATGLTTSY